MARRSSRSVALRLIMGLAVVGLLIGSPVGQAGADEIIVNSNAQVPAGGTFRINVPEALGGKTVIGQLTADQVVGAGFITAYPCAAGPPTTGGSFTRSDLNYDSRVSQIASNRLIVKADDDGNVCFYTLRPAAMIIDVNATTFDTGINSFPNRRTDTRTRATPRIPAGGTLTINVPEARGGLIVVGQLTVDQPAASGFITAYPCASGIPTNDSGGINRSDLNYRTQATSNRLIVQADANGDICLYTLSATAMIVDVNGVAGGGIQGLSNQRLDTRLSSQPVAAAGSTVRMNVPAARGGKTVIGQLTADRISGSGYATAYPCAAGVPGGSGGATRSDVNYDSRVSPVSSNRLIVQADANGDICIFTLRAAAIVIDINGVSDTGIDSFPNRRIDTRAPNVSPTPPPPVGGGNVPTWPAFTPGPALNGTAALTGRATSPEVSQRPILAVKIDNFSRARPQWGLERADAIIEENVEGVTRFIALYQTNLPDDVGPVRSARTGDLDLLFAMNRPVFSYSGANPGVSDWIRSATGSGLLIDFISPRGGCYRRSPEKPGPHNLVVNALCARLEGQGAGPARPMWEIAANWSPPAGASVRPDSTFDVRMDGVRISWTWDAGTRRYLRFQSDAPHIAVSGAQVAANTVVELFAEHRPSVVDERSPHPVTVGTGNAVVHRNGRAIDAIWSRAQATNPFTFLDRVTGQPIPMDVGITFIHIARP